MILSQLLLTLVPAGLMLAAFLPLVGLIFFAKRSLNRRRSPLVKELLRPPGYSVQQRVDNLRLDLESLCLPAFMLPLLAALGYYVLKDSSGNSTTRLFVFIGLTVASEIYIWIRLWKIYPRYRHAKLGLMGEQAVGEELNQLMLHGCRVYHDVPIQYGNIDHVVISHSGVFAVETKMYGQLVANNAPKRVTVDYNTNMLRFPDRTVAIPKQLETNSRCLRKLLSDAVGISIEVESILAVPGWFVERAGKPTVCVINPTNAAKFFVHSRAKLSPQLINQIAHQLDSICRDVPSSPDERLAAQFSLG